MAYLSSGYDNLTPSERAARGAWLYRYWIELNGARFYFRSPDARADFREMYAHPSHRGAFPTMPEGEDRP